MPLVQVELPTDLYEELRGRGLSASELLCGAVRNELERLQAIDSFDDYIAELADELGEGTPTSHER